MINVHQGAEVAEHHIEEEEGEILPDYKASFQISDRVTIGKNYLRLKARVKADVREIERVDQFEHPMQSQLQ